MKTPNQDSGVLMKSGRHLFALLCAVAGLAGLAGCGDTFTTPHYFEYDDNPIVDPVGYSTATACVDIDGAHNDVYFDFSSGTATTVAFEGAFSGEWDVKFTTSPMTFFGVTADAADIYLNADGGVLFYKEDLPMDEVLEVDTGELKGPGFEGYPHRNPILRFATAPYPRIGIIWIDGAGTFHVVEMTFVVQTTEGNYGKFQMLTYYGPNDEPFCSEFAYEYLEDGSTTFPAP